MTRDITDDQIRYIHELARARRKAWIMSPPVQAALEHATKEIDAAAKALLDARGASFRYKRAL